MAFLARIGLDGQCKAVGILLQDLEAGIAVVDLDGADLGLGNVAGAADQRQQPAGIGVALTADVEAEPDHIRSVRAGSAFGAWFARIRSPGPLVPARRACEAFTAITARTGAGFGITAAAGAVLAARRTRVVHHVFGCRQLRAVHAHECQSDLIGRAGCLQRFGERLIVIGRGIGEHGIGLEPLLVTGADCVGRGG